MLAHYGLWPRLCAIRRGIMVMMMSTRFSHSAVPGYQIPSTDRMTQAKPAFIDTFCLKYCLAGLWNAASSAFALVVPWALVKVIDDGIAPGRMQILFIWLGVAAVSQCLSGIFRYIGNCRVAAYALDAEKKSIMSLFSKMMSADLRALPELAQGQAMGQIVFASSSERHFFEVIYTQGMTLLVAGIGTAAALFALSWQIALFSLLICPAAAGLWIWMKKKIGPAVRDEYENRESLYRQIVDIFRAMTSIRALRLGDRFAARFEKTCDKSRDAAWNLEKKMAVQGPYFDVFQAFVLIAVFGFGGYAVTQNAVSIGALIGFQIYLSRLFGLMRSGTGIFGAWQQYIEGRARALDIQNLPSADDVHFESAGNCEVLHLDKVCFAFGEHSIWKDETLVIHKGERKALLLPSGAGKTTLARCILGLYPISSGSIAIPEGNPKKIGFVPQENVLFDGTIRENIELMSESLEDECYRDIVNTCGLEELVERFEGESIGEQGARLSGGEQRRVMLARALASKPELLIIDQMASELEPELCARIFDSICKKYPEMGIFYLGHRMPEW